MDKFLQKQPLPTIIISKASSPTDEINNRTPAYEPETEDNYDNGLLKNLIKELDIEKSIINEDDPLVHNPLSRNSCLHCILVKKISDLQINISKINQDINSTNEVLQLKKDQNLELKNMIHTIEGNCTGSQIGLETENKKATCGCMNKCFVF